ncbi:hypothetical protein IP69_00420 [Bosea sp. AAP35]|uniref:hypothetical protein n=1 Tax=Bosea sp. AAP35 TaxID=1523417 RepID=UPI0006B8B1BC|nr:hypothetical protein [Bosea sp. AAP35]KPF73076.1 hypothetical protein IP69_00420 [Bosea sp. AAP35]
MQGHLVCPYCDATLNASALSCRCCGRDLTPVLPLLRRLDAAEARLAGLDEARAQLEQALDEVRRFRAEAVSSPAAAPDESAAAEARGPAAADRAPVPRRRLWALPAGFLALLSVYGMVVLWLDLSLSVLRTGSIIVPFATGAIYLGVRSRLAKADIAVAIGFALFSVAAMNAWLGWSDNIPVLPQGTAAWRETMFYALSIGASLFAGMLLRVSQAALSAKGLDSLPELRRGLSSVHGKLPVETLKTIETTILMASTVLSVIAGLIAGLLGLK